MNVKSWPAQFSSWENHDSARWARWPWVTIIQRDNTYVLNSGNLFAVWTSHLPKWPDLQSVSCPCLICSKCNLGPGHEGDLRMTVCIKCISLGYIQASKIFCSRLTHIWASALAESSSKCAEWLLTGQHATPRRRLTDTLPQCHYAIFREETRKAETVNTGSFVILTKTHETTWANPNISSTITSGSLSAQIL